jgi:chemosensory pili system protein ChpA (sensor histidine kinase/response regulator)
MNMEGHMPLLALVRQQIDINLHQATEAAARHQDAVNGNAALAAAPLLAHQVTGALRMVQLPGAARFCAEIENALRAAMRAPTANKQEVARIADACGTLRDFVNDVADGGAYAPLKLFPVFRAIAALGGNDGVSEKDLFYPDLVDRSPPHANPRTITVKILPALVKDMRVRYQRGLLAWLKESANPAGVRQMRDVIDALHQIASQLPEPRGLWWAGSALLDAVMERLPEAGAAEWIARVKPVVSRMDFVMRDLAASGTADTAPSQRDVYYAIASCPCPTQRLAEARRVLELESLVDDSAQSGEAQRLRPLLEDARARLENIKDVWTEYAAGEPKRLQRFRELLTPITQKARELGSLPLTQLLLAMQSATENLPDPYPLDGQIMSLEMATSLLMAGDIVTHFGSLPADLEQQTNILKAWLADAALGKVASGLPEGLRNDIVRQVNDEKLRIATAREITKSLREVEKAVEQWSRDLKKRELLEPLPDILRQVQGVFEVCNQPRAGQLTRACRLLIERCARAADADATRDIEWIAEGLGSLGFYLEPSLQGKAPAERAINLFFTRHEKHDGFADLMGVSQVIAVSEAATPAGAAVQPVPADSPAAAPGAPGADREMLEIFLEEANEVMATLEAGIGAARRNPADHDALLNIRRAFHTLKGSSRMVGLGAFGDCAWELEQTLNSWNAKGEPATPELLDLADDARTLLAEWAHALQGEVAPAIDTSAIARRAAALRGETPPSGLTTAVTPVNPLALRSSASNGDDRGLETLIDMAAVTAPPTDANLQSLSFTSGGGATQAKPAPAPGTPSPPVQQTLADLGERLAWLNSLIGEIQEAAAGTRAADTAATLGESMAEVQALYQRLADELGKLPG